MYIMFSYEPISEGIGFQKPAKLSAVVIRCRECKHRQVVINKDLSLSFASLWHTHATVIPLSWSKVKHHCYTAGPAVIFLSLSLSPSWLSRHLQRVKSPVFPIDSIL